MTLWLYGDHLFNFQCISLKTILHKINVPKENQGRKKSWGIMNVFQMDVIDQTENGNTLAEVEHYNRIDKSMVPRWLKKEGN